MLAATGKQILLLERGNFLREEKENWYPAPAFIDGRYISADTWYDADGKPFQLQVHYFVSGATKMYGAAPPVVLFGGRRASAPPSVPRDGWGVAVLGRGGADLVDEGAQQAKPGFCRDVAAGQGGATGGDSPPTTWPPAAMVAGRSYPPPAWGCWPNKFGCIDDMDRQLSRHRTERVAYRAALDAINTYPDIHEPVEVDWYGGVGPLPG